MQVDNNICAALPDSNTAVELQLSEAPPLE
jgi:hypothetical protein